MLFRSEDAEENGSNFFPQNGGLVPVIVDAGTDRQLTVIEVPASTNCDTAWALGTRFDDSKSWGMYFTYQLQ